MKIEMGQLVIVIESIALLASADRDSFLHYTTNVRFLYIGSLRY